MEHLSAFRVLMTEGGRVGEAGDEHLRGYRYGLGRALCLVEPATVAEVSRVVGYCVRNGIGFVPQGANTGLVGASIPDDSGEQIVLGLSRLAGIEQFDALDRSVVVKAGTRLSAVNGFAEEHDLFFPIDLGADPSIGGMIAANTGGAKLIRYGDVQRNLLGLEVVLADAEGTVLSDLGGLRKDNSGVDWKQLFVGTGGAFGVVTRASLELHRRPLHSLTALLVPRDLDAVPEIIALLEQAFGEMLSACEGMSRNAIDAALRHHPALRDPFGGDLPDYALLVELSVSAKALAGLDLELALGEALLPSLDTPSPLVTDVLIGRGEDFWHLRHAITDGLRRDGWVLAFDLSVPRSRFARFIGEARGLVTAAFPEARTCDFGHCGDGGVHLNIVFPGRAGPPEDAAALTALRDAVYALTVEAYHGSFSAEHGLGPHNMPYYHRFTPPAERDLVRRLKHILDPAGVSGHVAF